jgi:CubicO group peptidase (beta-lactamase class C family)
LDGVHHSPGLASWRIILRERSIDYDQIVETFRAAHGIPGLSIAIARNGVLLHAAGYGLANLENRVPATAETVYQSASVGKQFTAALVLSLAEAGVLRIDDPIAPYFGDAPDTWRGIAIRHLLTHTSGIGDAGYSRLNRRLDYSDAELVAAIASAPLQSEPGGQWSYSNSGYILLGILIERLTSRFYGDLLEERIFGLLDMRTARVITEQEIVPNRASGYLLENGVVRNQEYVSPTLNRTADGSLLLTVLDLAKWDRALDRGTALLPASRAQMWTPVKLNDGSEYPYGFGWSVKTTPRGRVARHDGDWQGFSTHFARNLDDGLSVAVLANLADAPVSELAKSFLTDIENGARFLFDS